ncbi:MAG: heat-inducible transcriptional repressor HrcA [Rhodothermaceae bacterium]
MLNLSEREKSILRDIIYQFILTANPVGSRNIAKKSDLQLSAATIRNIMADLEEAGYLQHPHTSAGRVPTDLGYRVYVDSLMGPSRLNDDQKKIITKEFDHIADETDDILQLTATVLSKITNQLACITYPKINNAILEKIQIVKLSSSKIMVIVEIKSGLVKTITLELNSEIQETKLYLIQQFLNERLGGLNFDEIKKTFADRIKDYNPDYNPIIRVFFDSVDKIFTEDSHKKAIITGATNIVKQPEFEDQQQFRSVVELIENQDIIIHIMDDDLKSPEQTVISIGNENDNQKFTDYSMIKKTYNIGNVHGTVGIIGPKRMEYSQTIAAVVYIAELLKKELKM